MYPSKRSLTTFQTPELQRSPLVGLGRCAGRAPAEAELLWSSDHTDWGYSAGSQGGETTEIAQQGETLSTEMIDGNFLFWYAAVVQLFNMSFWLIDNAINRFKLRSLFSILVKIQVLPSFLKRPDLSSVW